MSGPGAGTDGLQRELEPNILPRQLHALEAVAARLDTERPAPSQALRASLESELRELGVAGLASWRIPAWACIAAGLAVLLVTALLAL